MALNVHPLFPLTVLCTWPKAAVKIFIVFAILKGTVTASMQEACAWDFGLVTVQDMATPTDTQVGIQCLASLSRKYLKVKLKTETSNHSCTNIHKG